MKNRARLYDEYADVLDGKSDPSFPRLVGTLDALYQTPEPPPELRLSITHLAEVTHPYPTLAGERTGRPERSSPRDRQLLKVTRFNRLASLFAAIPTIQKRPAIGLLALFLALVSAVILVPSLVAQVMEWSKPQIVFEVPNGHGQAAAIDWPGFQPLNPTYLPEASWQFYFGGEEEKGIKYLTLTYLLDNQFVRILQSKAGTVRNLPQGTLLQVKSQPAVLITGVQGMIPFTEITYTDAHQISWYFGDARIDLLSNLSDTEMLKIAESLVPAKQRDVTFQVLPNGADAPYPLHTPVPRSAP